MMNLFILCVNRRGFLVIRHLFNVQIVLDQVYWKCPCTSCQKFVDNLAISASVCSEICHQLNRNRYRSSSVVRPPITYIFHITNHRSLLSTCFHFVSAMNSSVILSVSSNRNHSSFHSPYGAHIRPSIFFFSALYTVSRKKVPVYFYLS